MRWQHPLVFVCGQEDGCYGTNSPRNSDCSKTVGGTCSVSMERLHGGLVAFKTSLWTSKVSHARALLIFIPICGEWEEPRGHQDTQQGVTYPEFPPSPWPETSETAVLVKVWGPPEWQQCPRPPPSCRGCSPSGWFPEQTGLLGRRHSTGLSPSTSSEVGNDRTDAFNHVHLL